MAARPNTLRTLEYGVRLAENHIKRLNEMIAMVERALDDNRLLTPEDINTYKQSIRAAKKQLTACTKLGEVEIPKGSTSTQRKTRGRPSKAELEGLAASRGEKPKRGRKPKAEVVEAAPKKRGRKPKAEAVEAAPKRRGRKPKAEAAPVPEVPKKKRGRPSKADIAAREAAAALAAAPKRRGRPPKAKTVEASATTATPKRRGRPPKANSVATASA